MPTNIPVNISVKPPVRGIGSQQPATFVAQSMTASFAWGSNPGTATLVYVGNAAGIQTGSLLELSIGAYFFAGICKSDVLNVGSSEGTTRTLQFVDLREYLKWDWSFCCFNKPDVRLIGGVRFKRYKHIFPGDYGNYVWTFTNDPIAAGPMLASILSGPSVNTPWSVDVTGNGQFPLGLMGFPIYDFDCLNGKRVDAVVNEICEKSGCVVGLFSTPGSPYRLIFTRKGYGPLPSPPSNSDNRRVGVSLTDHPNNVTILGERNRYQVMNVPMQPDWARGWEQFISFELFADDIYHRLGYDKTPNDPEQYRGRQFANARALSITVREYSELRGDQSALFADSRKFAGRWRMDMPAALYISTLLFRAFRPGDSFSLVNVEGAAIPLTSAEIADGLLCKVFQNDPTSGTMNFDPNVPTDGNGYAIAKGYLVGADLFKMIRSDQFSLDFFLNPQNVWQHIPFQIDDSGEGVRFIIFDEPVIVSNNLVLESSGQRALNAQFTLQVPPVIAALVFEAERFEYLAGAPGRQAVENVSGLNLEMVVNGDQYTEILYANGMGAIAKAQQIANSVLLRQIFYADGGFKHIWVPGTSLSSFGVPLSSMIDRVQITTGPREGTYAIVDYTTERQRDFFEPERELDRRTQTNSLFPGQAELRVQAENSRKLAAAFKQLPKLGSQLRELLTGTLGSDEPLALTWFGSLGREMTGLMPLGTVLRKKPTAIGDQNTNTVATDPVSISEDDNIFLGVTVRHNEDPNRPFRIQRTGVAPCRVQGPVKPGDAVGLSSYQDTFDWQYLVPGGNPTVGRSQGTIGDSTILTIPVDFTGGGSVAAQTYLLLAVWGDYLACHTCNPDGTNEGDVTIYIAKEALHRQSVVEENEFGETIKYTYREDPEDASDWEGSGLGGIGNVIRTKTEVSTGQTEDASVTPSWRLGEVINAIPADTGVFVEVPDLDKFGDPVIQEVKLLITGRSCQWLAI